MESFFQILLSFSNYLPKTKIIQKDSVYFSQNLAIIKNKISFGYLGRYLLG